MKHLSAVNSQNVCPHRQVSVDAYAKITQDADWRKQVATDNKLIGGPNKQIGSWCTDGPPMYTAEIRSFLSSVEVGFMIASSPRRRRCSQ